MHFITPIRILYLTSFGLTYAQIGLMELAAAIVIVLLEIPSGVFADFVGRKTARIISYVLSIIAFTCLSFGSSAPIFIFGWAISGAADAFQSGANDALIYDTLKEINREKDYLKMKSHFLLINTISVIFSSIIGAWLYTINHRLPWYLITFTIVLSTLVFLTIKEPTKLLKHKKLSDQLKEFKQSLTLSLSRLDVRRLIILSLILGLPMYVFTTLLNQPYLISRGFNVQSLGFVFAFITGISGLAASFSHKIENKLKKQLSFLLIFISFSVLLVLLGLTQHQLALVFVIVFYIVNNYKNIIIDNYINQSIDSDSRATMLSVQSFMNNIFISIIFVFIGYLTDLYSINVVLISMGIFISLAYIPFIKLK